MWMVFLSPAAHLNRSLHSSLITRLDSVFALRDLGRLSYFLEIEVSYHEGSMHLSQTKFTSDLLHRTTMFNTKAAKTLGAVE
jgi:hypothetical protein